MEGRKTGVGGGGAVVRERDLHSQYNTLLVG